MESIGEAEILRRLTFENPWWNLRSDGDIKFRQPPRRIFFDGFAKTFENAAPGETVVLAGPRRTGKSVMLRQLIAHVIETGAIGPQAVLYASLATPSYWGLGIPALIDTFVRRHDHITGTRLMIVLDEVQYLRNWRAALAEVAKARPDIQFVASASSGAPGLTGSMATLEPACPPADAGAFRVVVLPPLTFLEFLRIRGTETEIFGDNPGKRVALRQQAVPNLNQEFVRYVNFGGFPEGIMTRTEGTPPPTFVRDSLIDRLLHKEVAGGANAVDMWDLNRMFTVLARNTGSEISIEELAKIVGLAKNTVRKYMDLLESAFLIHRMERLDESANPYQRAVSFKVHLTTSCLYAALFGPVGPDDPAFARLAETALVAQWVGGTDSGPLFYAGWRNGGVGFVRTAADPSHANGNRFIEMAEVDWNETVITGAKGPRALGKFVKANAPDATAFLYSRSQARQGTIDGQQINVLPVAFACYRAALELK